MKIRTGFISNSSSCSFSIMRDGVSVQQYDHLINHIAFSKLKKWHNDNYYDYNEHDAWNIVLEDNVIKCQTLMDNFNLRDYIVEVLKVPQEAIFDYDN